MNRQIASSGPGGEPPAGPSFERTRALAHDLPEGPSPTGPLQPLLRLRNEDGTFDFLLKGSKNPDDAMAACMFETVGTA